MGNSLPKNWVNINLGIAAEITSGYGFPLKHQGFTNYEIPFFKVGDISENIKKGKVFLSQANNYINEDILKSIKAKKLSSKSIVFAKIGEAIRLNRRAITSEYCVVDNNIMALTFNKNVQFKYGYYFFQTVKLIDLSSGNTVPSIRKSIVENLIFPLPPLPEQERIVAKLDALFAQHEAMKKALERIPQLLKDFRQQVLTHAVTGKLTEKWREKTNNLVEWELKKLDEISLSITDGDHQAPPKSESGVPFLVISNISDGKLNFNHISRYVPINYYEKLKDIRKPNTGDILYTVTGSYGIPVLVNEKIDFCFQRHIAIIKPDPQKVYNIFLYYYLKSQNILEQAKECATGTAQLTVPLSGLRKFILKVPTILEQHEIINRIENLFSKADIIEERYKTLKEKIDSLPQAILHKAFKGELVPQLPTDGDAKDLLEEILKLKKEVKKK